MGATAFKIRNRACQALAGAAVAAIAFSGLTACSFTASPSSATHSVAPPPPAGDVGAYARHIDVDGQTYVLLDGGLYALQRDDAGTPHFVAVDGGGVLELGPELDAGELPRSSGDAGVEHDAGELEPDAATSAPARVLCTATCIDGTFKCPSAASSSGYVCRSWPPCYCGDGGMP